jgi:hypothetical protein
MKWIKASKRKPSIDRPIDTVITAKYNGIGIGLILLKNDYHGIGWHTVLHTNGFSNSPSRLGARTFILPETWEDIEWLDESLPSKEEAGDVWNGDFNIVVEYVRQVLIVSFENGKVNGHDFSAGFPQPFKKQIHSDLFSMLLYAIEWVVASSATYEKDINGYRYEFLKDTTLKLQPTSMGLSRVSHYNLWTILKLLKSKYSITKL